MNDWLGGQEHKDWSVRLIRQGQDVQTLLVGHLQGWNDCFVVVAVVVGLMVDDQARHPGQQGDSRGMS